MDQNLTAPGYTFREREGTLCSDGHRWDYETWTWGTWQIWAAWYADDAAFGAAWVDLGGES